MTDVIKIDGRFYSTEKLAAMHPGGPVFVDQCNNKDGTSLYNSSHRHPFDHEKYKHMLVDPKQVSNAFDKTQTFNQDFSLYWEICEKIKPHVAATNGFAPPIHFLKPAVILSVFFAVNISLFFYKPAWNWTLFVFGMSMAFIGLTVQHDGNHGAWSRNWKVNRFLGAAQCLLGASALSWMTDHNCVHHVNCNDIERDHDLEVPLSRFHERTILKAWHSLQHVYIFVLSLGFAPLHMLNDVVKLLLGPERLGQSRLKPYWTTDTIIACSVLLRYILLVVQYPSWDTVLWLLTAHAIGGGYLAFFFILSHNFEGVKKTGVDATTGCFVKHQVETSSNVGGAILGFFNGGLNYQIEHHLFPRIHHSYYPTIAPIVRAVCLKHGIQYVHFDTVMQNAQSTVNHLRQLGTKALA